MDAAAVRAAVPAIAADAHKGTRGRLLVVGGDVGMAGATILAARGALRAGIGMVRMMVAAESVSAVQSGEPAAMAMPWVRDDASLAEAVAWADAVLVGPGLGRTADAQRLLEGLLASGAVPMLIDADGLWPLSGRLDALAATARRRALVLTPHVGEFARLVGMSAAEVSRTRFDAPAAAATRAGATILLKGVPTVISDGSATRISATGTPVLATGGSGDLLGGIVATLLAQGVPAMDAAAAGAWIHGRAAEIAGAGQVRGVTVHDVVDALPAAWRLTAAPAQTEDGWTLPALPNGGVSA
jgi:NAD(P)H-hydrate epimerase